MLDQSAIASALHDVLTHRPELPTAYLTIDHPGVDRRFPTDRKRQLSIVGLHSAIANALAVVWAKKQWPHRPTLLTGATRVDRATAHVLVGPATTWGEASTAILAQALTAQACATPVEMTVGEMAGDGICVVLTAHEVADVDAEREAIRQAELLAPHVPQPGETIDDLPRGAMPARNEDTPMTPEILQMAHRLDVLQVLTPEQLAERGANDVGDKTLQRETRITGGGGSRSGRKSPSEKPGEREARKQAGSGPRWVEDEPRDHFVGAKVTATTRGALDASGVTASDWLSIALAVQRGLADGSLTTQTAGSAFQRMTTLAIEGDA